MAMAEGRKCSAESFMNIDIVRRLSDRGHKINLLHDYGLMGRGQIIWRLDNGVYCGGTEPRTGGAVCVW